MAALHQGHSPGEWVISEEPRSRENVDLANSLYPYESGTLLGRSNTATITETPAATNTGDGATGGVTAEADVYPGLYTLTIDTAEVAQAVTGVVADVGNTGNGTIEPVTADTTAKTGDYVVEVTAAAVDPYVISAEAFPENTGGAVLGEVTADAATVQVGAYTIEITAEAPDAGTFSVTGPDAQLVANGTVGVAFNDEIAFTLADAAEDANLGDKWLVIVHAAEPAEFSVTDPDAALVGTGYAGLAFADEIGFTLTEGVVPFAAGDLFTVSVTEYEPAGFTVTRHDGTTVATGVTGTEFSDEITFTLAEGAASFAPADVIEIAVGAGAGVYKALPQGMTDDGSDTAVGFLADFQLSADGTGTGVAILRKAVLNRDELPVLTTVDFTDPTDPAVVALAARGIVLRASL